MGRNIIKMIIERRISKVLFIGYKGRKKMKEKGRRKK